MWVGRDAWRALSLLCLCCPISAPTLGTAAFRKQSLHCDRGMHPFTPWPRCKHSCERNINGQLLGYLFIYKPPVGIWKQSRHSAELSLKQVPPNEG